jgi:hypothetical protein
VGRHSLIAFFVVLLGAAPAWSAEPSEDSVVFHDSESDPLGESAFLRALGHELGVDLVRPNGGSPPDIEVRFRCDSRAIIRIRLANGSVERTVRFADVAKRERARALALVVAELARSSSQNGAPSDSSSPEPSDGEGNSSARPGEPNDAAARPNAEPKEAPARPNAEPKEAAARPNAEPKEAAPPLPAEPKDTGPSETSPKSTRSSRFRAGVTARAALGNSAKHFGVDLGLDLPLFRIQGETLFARESRARGSITSGIAALRLGHDVRFAHAGMLSAQAGLSVAAGATWAVGQSEVPWSVVRDVLMPYFDARFEATALWQVSAHFEPYLELYTGRAAGIVATADGETTQSTGGWFAGIDLGSRF